MKGLSKRHYELFKEIINALPKKPIEESPNQAEIEDKIAEFIQCFFDDNYFGYEAPEDIKKASKKFEDNSNLKFIQDAFDLKINSPEHYMLPKIKVLEIENVNEGGHYNFLENEIVINKKFISDIACGKKSIYSLVAVIGHEFGHFLQCNVDFDELTDQDKKNYLKNIFDGVFERKEDFLFLKNLDVQLHSDKTKKIIKSTCKKFKDEIPFADNIYTFLDFENEARQYIINCIESSNYLGLAHEDDARYRQVIFVSQFINDAINAANKNGEKEYEELFINDKKEIKKMTNEVEEDYKDERFFKNYQSDIAEVELEDLFVISADLINNGMDPYYVRLLLHFLQNDRYHAIMKTELDIKELISSELASIASTTDNFVESKKKMYEELKLLKRERAQKENEKWQKEKNDPAGFLHGKYKYMQKDIDEIKTEEQQLETDLSEFVNDNKGFVTVLFDLYNSILKLSKDIKTELSNNKFMEESAMQDKMSNFSELE